RLEVTGYHRNFYPCVPRLRQRRRNVSTNRVLKRQQARKPVPRLRRVDPRIVWKGRAGYRQYPHAKSAKLMSGRSCSRDRLVAVGAKREDRLMSALGCIGYAACEVRPDLRKGQEMRR